MIYNSYTISLAYFINTFIRHTISMCTILCKHETHIIYNSQFTAIWVFPKSDFFLGNSQFNMIINNGVWIVMHEYTFICIFTARRFHDLRRSDIYNKRNNSYFISRNLPWPNDYAQYAFFGIAVPLFHTYFKFTMSEIMLKVAF